MNVTKYLEPPSDVCLNGPHTFECKSSFCLDALNVLVFGTISL